MYLDPVRRYSPSHFADANSPRPPLSAGNGGEVLFLVAGYEQRTHTQHAPATDEHRRPPKAEEPERARNSKQPISKARPLRKQHTVGTTSAFATSQLAGTGKHPAALMMPTEGWTCACGTRWPDLLVVKQRQPVPGNPKPQTAKSPSSSPLERRGEHSWPNWTTVLCQDCDPAVQSRSANDLGPHSEYPFAHRVLQWSGTAARNRSLNPLGDTSTETSLWTNDGLSVHQILWRQVARPLIDARHSALLAAILSFMNHWA
ncbi:hypothetical protein C8R43DRAFT_1164453 [Mycena crocata]|nr:hypothetical protein C8R43DRAFT_1164453 [Mycena crocata]